MKTRISLVLLLALCTAASAQTLSVRSIDLDEYAFIGTPLTITGTVANNGTSPVASYDLFYIANGDTSATMHIERTIAAGSFGGFTHGTRYTPAAAGTLTVTVVALNPDGDSTAQPASLTVALPVYDNSKAVQRNVLLEQFTTINCVYCPGGHDRIHQAINGRNDVVWVCHHAGYGTDSLTISASTTLLGLYGGSTWAPAMTLDRTRMDESKPGCVMNVASSAASIRQQVNQAAAVPAFIEMNIAVDYAANDPAGPIEAICPRVWGRFTADLDIPNPRLSLFLIEDSIIGNQTGASGLYQHDYVIRQCVSDVWGDANIIKSTKEDSTFWHAYYIPVNPKYRLHKCRLVAFVSNYDASDINNRRVYNAIQTPRDLQTLIGIAEPSLDNTLTVYPNPASGQLYVDCGSAVDELTLLDISGRPVLTQHPAHPITGSANSASHPSAGSVNSAAGSSVGSVNSADVFVHTLQVGHLPAGLYILRVRSASSTATRKVVITR